METASEDGWEDRFWGDIGWEKRGIPLREKLREFG
jgi:hypothetical protein